MQNMMDMHEKFCAFHGLQLNKEKCEHMAMNAPAHTLQWTGEKERLQEAEANGEGEQVLGTIRDKVQVATKVGEGRHMKYLGVTFEAKRGWARQRAMLERDSTL